MICKAWILHKLGLLFLTFFFGKVWVFISPKDRIKTTLFLARSCMCQFCTCRAQLHRRAGAVHPHVLRFWFFVVFASSAESPCIRKGCSLSGRSCLREVEVAGFQSGMVLKLVFSFPCSSAVVFWIQLWFYVNFSMGNVYGIGYQWKMYLVYELFCWYPLFKWLIAVNSTSLWPYRVGDWFNLNNWFLPWSICNDLICNRYKSVELPEIFLTSSYLVHKMSQLLHGGY